MCHMVDEAALKDVPTPARAKLSDPSGSEMQEADTPLPET